MGRVRAAGFRQRDLREAAGQPRRPAQGDRDFVFQGSGCRLGETGNPDRPQGHWHGSVWPVGYSNQHYGKAISTLFAGAAVPGLLPLQGVDSVSTPHRSFLLASLLPAFLLVSVFAVVQAHEGRGPSARPARWSDPATWPDRQVPRAGDKVTIAAGKDVVLDVSPPALGGLTIDGKLSFANSADLELTTEWIMLHGELEIGTEAKPHTRKATITFTNNVKDEDIGGMGGANDRSDRGIALMGGTLNLHGDRQNTWTKLAQTAAAGSDSIQVLNASGWR